MNKIITYGLLIISSFSFAQELPSLVLKDLDGNDINLNTLVESENIFVFSFWATWCVPCINELDAISEVYEDWQDETKVKLIAIATDDTRTKKRVRPMVNGKGWEYLVLYDDNQDLKRALNITTLPHTLVLKNQKIIQRRTGYNPGVEDELYEIIKENSN
ncbi:MAG: TlpA disulfide reductase family protein [Flavobacteriaceae bacterium]|nr:TlpA disulfide reductase family protein [Flavobacteriaceae bacterium]